MSQTIVKFDHASLDELESVIEKGTWEVGSALTAIRERKLYLKKNGGDHDTFEDYCEQRWGFTKQYAGSLMRGTQVIENLKRETNVSLPKSEGQVRPLTRLEPAEQVSAWREAVASAPNGRVTARHVEAAVERIKPKHKPRPGGKVIDTRVYLCLDSADADWSAQEIVRSLAGHVEFIRELIDALETLMDEE